MNFRRSIWKVYKPEGGYRVFEQANLQIGANITCDIPEGVRHWCEDEYQNEYSDVTHHDAGDIQRCYIV